MTEELTIDDYKEVFEDHKRLVRELDLALNGDGAAKQASLCDIVAQVKDNRFFLVRHPKAAERINALEFVQELREKLIEQLLQKGRDHATVLKRLEASKTIKDALYESDINQQWHPMACVPEGVILLFCDMKAQELRNTYFVDWVVDGKFYGNRERKSATHWKQIKAPKAYDLIKACGL